MKLLTIALISLLLSACNIGTDDTGRYQMHADKNMNLYRIDTKTGEIIFVEAAAVAAGSSGYTRGKYVIVMPPDHR